MKYGDPTMRNIPGTQVIVRDKMQRGYRHRTEPPGKNFALDFTPDLTPSEMLALGVFSGKYLSDCRVARVLPFVQANRPLSAISPCGYDAGNKVHPGEIQEMTVRVVGMA